MINDYNYSQNFYFFVHRIVFTVNVPITYVTTCNTRKSITNLLPTPFYLDTNWNENSNTCTGKQVSEYLANNPVVYLSIFCGKETCSLLHSGFQDEGVRMQSPPPGFKEKKCNNLYWETCPHVTLLGTTKLNLHFAIPEISISDQIRKGGEGQFGTVCDAVCIVFLKC